MKRGRSASQVRPSIDELGASSNLFSVLGEPLFLGRAFLPEEDRPGGAPVAILSYSLWQRRFGGNPAALGSSLVLDGKRYTVVGITRPTAAGWTTKRPMVYTPMGQNTAPYMQRRGPHPVTTIARLSPGATLAQAQAELAMIGRHLAGNIRIPIRTADSRQSNCGRTSRMCDPRCGCCWARSAWCC